MWIIEASVPCTIHLNFRSERHVAEGNAGPWLARKGFALNHGMRSACSSGIPNGPYMGPVYSKECEPGAIELNGSNTWEGVYFVFVETGTIRGGAAAPDNDGGLERAEGAQDELPAPAGAGEGGAGEGDGGHVGELQRV